MNQPTPPVVMWAKIYEGGLALVYLGLVVAGIVFVVADIPTKADDLPPAVMGGIFLVLGVPFTALFGLALFLKPTPGTWVLHIVCIALGMTSACCMPAAIPLLIFWLKPETKAYFGRTQP